MPGVWDGQVTVRRSCSLRLDYEEESDVQREIPIDPLFLCHRHELCCYGGLELGWAKIELLKGWTMDVPALFLVGME